MTMVANSEVKKENVIDTTITPLRRFEELSEEEKSKVMEVGVLK